MPDIVTTVPTDQVSRVKAALVADGLDPAATPAQTLQAVENLLAHHLRQYVRNHERRVAETAINVDADAVVS